MLGDAEEQVQVIRDLTAAQSYQEIRAAVTQAARSLLEADGVTLVLREGDLCYYAEEDAMAPLWKGRRFPMSACISGWAMREREPVTIEDIYADSRIPHDAYRPTFVRSLAMVPMEQDDPIAAMGAYWAKKRTVSASEVELLRCIASVAGLTISNVELRSAKERLQAKEAKQQLMVSEMRHRFRNHLSVIAALLRQTLKSTESMDEFAKSFSGRLEALARAQTLLGSSDVGALDLQTTLREQLAVTGGGAQVVCSGPDVILRHEDALDLGLVIYELSTNACKYGALSSEKGQVKIEWAVEAIEGSRRLELCWREEDGPPVRMPQKTGFGSTLIEHALKSKGGAAEIHYKPTGVVCQLSLPVK